MFPVLYMHNYTKLPSVRFGGPPWSGRAFCGCHLCRYRRQCRQYQFRTRTRPRGRARLRPCFSSLSRPFFVLLILDVLLVLIGLIASIVLIVTTGECVTALSCRSTVDAPPEKGHRCFHVGEVVLLDACGYV